MWLLIVALAFAAVWLVLLVVDAVNPGPLHELVWTLASGLITAMATAVALRYADLFSARRRAAGRHR